MTRRDFLVGAGALALGGCRTAKVKAADAYEVVILGDTHYDAEPASIYHANYNEKVAWLNRVQRAEFARNGEMWRARCPRLLRRAAQLVNPRTAFTLQTGDLVQGDCGDGDVHRRMLADTADKLKAALGGKPFVTVVGNHDIRGVDAEQAYLGYMPDRMSRELGRAVEGTNFGFPCGDDAWIVVDFNRPDAAAVDALLDAAKGARRTFVVSHGPVLPSDTSSCRWMFLGGADAATTELRLHFRRRFAEREAIVIAGHTHLVELMDWEGDGGRITQLVANSVWSSPGLASLTMRAEGPANYGALQKRAKKRDDGSKAPDESAFFEGYRPGMKRYFSATGAGSFALRVNARKVVAEFYGGAADVPTAWWTLRG